jgi:hypothetical protein
MPEPKPKEVSFKTKKLIGIACRTFYYFFRYAFSIFTTWLEYDDWSGYN